MEGSVVNELMREVREEGRKYDKRRQSKGIGKGGIR